METQGLEIFLSSSDFLSYCTEVSINIDCRELSEQATFCDLPQPPRTFGFCTRTHHSGELPWLRWIRTSASASPGSLCLLLDLAQLALVKMCPCACLVCGRSILAVWQKAQTYLSGDTDLDNSASFTGPSPCSIQLICSF